MTAVRESQQLFIHSFISWIVTLCLFAETLSTEIVARKYTISEARAFFSGYYMTEYDGSVRNTESVCVCVCVRACACVCVCVCV